MYLFPLCVAFLRHCTALFIMTITLWTIIIRDIICDQIIYHNFDFVSWRDLGLLRSSFSIGSTQILDTYIQTGSLVPMVTENQVRVWHTHLWELVSLCNCSLYVKKFPFTVLVSWNFCNDWSDGCLATEAETCWEDFQSSRYRRKQIHNLRNAGQILLPQSFKNSMLCRWL